MSTPQEFLQRIAVIVGDDISDGELNLRFQWRNYAEAKVLLARIRAIQKEVRLLKKDVNATISAIKSQFTTARTSVGKSFGAGLAAGLFGRRNMGRVNATRRDELRRNQIDAVEPYENVKRIFDRILHQFDEIKGKIELSPQYQIRTSQDSEAKRQSPAPSAPINRRYFVFVTGQVKGPYTTDQLRALYDTSAIRGDTPCCPEGYQTWTPFSQIVAARCP